MKVASRRGIAGRVKSRVTASLSIKKKGGLSAAFQLFYAVRRRIAKPASPRAASNRPIIGQVGMPPPVVASVGVAGVAVGAAVGVGVGVAVTAAVPVNLRFISTAIPV